MLGRLISLLLVLVFLAGGYVWWVTRDLPTIQELIRQEGTEPGQLAMRSTQIMSEDGTVIMSEGQFRHTYVKFQDVSPYFIKALLATEDRRFLEHQGVDPIAIGRALVRNLTQGKLLEGGSTLTQQLVRNLYLTNERSASRKIKEMVLAAQLESTMTKEQILELYINNTYFGEGAYGIYGASEVYFNKKPADLAVEEAAMLAGLPQAPSQYSPFNNPELAKKRRNEVLANLVEAGLLPKEELETYQNKPLNVNPQGRKLASGNKAPYFNQYIISQVRSMFDLDEQAFWQQGFKIYTTLNPRAQQLAEQSLTQQLRSSGFTGDGDQAALVSLNIKTGAILAYVGGKDFQTSQFDRASMSQRSPGSLFKIFTYTAALEKGYLPYRVYLDEPVQFGNWSPHNYGGGHSGYMTIAGALARSNNIVAVKVLNEIGPPAVIDVAHRMGIHSQLENNLSLTLGGTGVNVMELTSAVGALGNHGVRAVPYGLVRITDAKGRLLYQYQPRKQDVLPPQVADTMVSMLEGVVLHGTGKGAYFGSPAAGKTGTSDDNRDAWFVGFTPDVITGVWMGKDNNQPMSATMVGGAVPAKIWRGYMKNLMAGRPPQDFVVPDSLDVPDEVFFTYDMAYLSQSERYDPTQDHSTPKTTLENGENTPEGEQQQGILLDPQTNTPIPDTLPASPDGNGLEMRGPSTMVPNNPTTMPPDPLTQGRSPSHTSTSSSSFNPNSSSGRSSSEPPPPPTPPMPPAPPPN